MLHFWHDHANRTKRLLVYRQFIWRFAPCFVDTSKEYRSTRQTGGFFIYIFKENHMTLPELPIIITPEQQGNKFIAPRLAAEAFRAAGYDLTPDSDPVSRAITLGFMKVKTTEVPDE